jgi:hypothetical protein
VSRGWCQCCLHITRVGDDGPRRVWAAYAWLTKSGTEVLLCERCCCHWRATAVDDPDLEPVLISSL